jgi:hypothetical protein
MIRFVFGLFTAIVGAGAIEGDAVVAGFCISMVGFIIVVWGISGMVRKGSDNIG